MNFSAITVREVKGLKRVFGLPSATLLTSFFQFANANPYKYSSKNSSGKLAVNCRVISLNFFSMRNLAAA